MRGSPAGSSGAIPGRPRKAVRAIRVRNPLSSSAWGVVARDKADNVARVEPSQVLGHSCCLVSFKDVVGCRRVDGLSWLYVANSNDDARVWPPLMRDSVVRRAHRSAGFASLPHPQLFPIRGRSEVAFAPSPSEDEGRSEVAFTPSPSFDALRVARQTVAASATETESVLLPLLLPIERGLLSKPDAAAFPPSHEHFEMPWPL